MATVFFLQSIKVNIIGWGVFVADNFPHHYFILLIWCILDGYSLAWIFTWLFGPFRVHTLMLRLLTNGCHVVILFLFLLWIAGFFTALITMAIALLNDSKLRILLFLFTLGRLSTINIAVRESLFPLWDLDHLHLWLSHDLTLYVIVAVRLYSYQELVVILVDLILDLGAAKK